jgi:hypothetical protein
MGAETRRRTKNGIVFDGGPFERIKVFDGRPQW